MGAEATFELMPTQLAPLTLFTRDTDRGAAQPLRVIPSWLTAGPWSADAQHGGPPSALLAWAIRAHENPVVSAPVDETSDPRLTPPARAFALVRCTVELLRPVPVAPLTLSVRTIRPGKRVQLVEAALWADGEPGDGAEVARAIGMRIRSRSDAFGEQPFTYPQEGIELTDQHVAATMPTSHPDDVSSADLSARGEGFHSRATDLRFTRSHLATPGPGTMWGRLLYPFIDDEWITGVPLAVCLADFGNAIGSTLLMAEWGYMNTDLTVNAHREPRGEWICVDSVVQLDPGGFGVASSHLYDQTGSVGRSTASLFIAQQAG